MQTFLSAVIYTPPCIKIYNILITIDIWVLDSGLWCLEQFSCWFSSRFLLVSSPTRLSSTRGWAFAVVASPGLAPLGVQIANQYPSSFVSETGMKNCLVTS